MDHSNQAVLERLSQLVEQVQQLRASDAPDQDLISAHQAVINDTTRELNHLVEGLITHQKLEEAYEMLTCMLLQLKTLYGTSCIRLVPVLSNMGKVCRLLQNYPDSLTYYRQALEIETKEVGGESEEVAWTLNHIGNVLQEQEQWEEAQEYYLRSLALKEKHYGNTSTHVATTLNNIASIYQRQEKFSDALNCFERALQILRHASSSTTHPAAQLRVHTSGVSGLSHQRGEPTVHAIALVLNNMGSVEHALGHLDQALEYFRESLSVKENAFGPDSVEVSNTLFNMANVLKQKKELAQAKELYSRCLHIREEKLGVDSPQSQEVCKALE